MSSLSCLVKFWFPFLRFPLQTPLFRVAVWIPLWPFERSHLCSSSFLSNFGSRMLGSLVIIKRPLLAAKAGFFPGVLVEQVFSVRFVSFLSEGVFPFLILIHEVSSTEELCFASRQLSYFLLEHQAYFLWPGETIIFLMRIRGFVCFLQAQLLSIFW